MKIICIGDSITYGYPYGMTYSWVRHLAVSKGWHLVNAGVSGETSLEILNRVKQCQYFDEDIDMAIIMCGSNDMIFSINSIEKTFNNILEILDIAVTNGAKPVLVTPILTIPSQAENQWNCGTNYPEVNRQLGILRDMICKFGKDSGYKVIDLQQKYKSFNQYCDGVHPTEGGYKFISEFFEEELKNE